MKRSFILIIAAALSLSACSSNHEPWKLVWSDEFDNPVLNDSVWTRVGRGQSDWNKMMSLRSDLVYIEDGELVLLGKVNDNLEADPTPFIAGGIRSRDKKTFRLAKFEIRAKFNSAQGFWPALWLMPQGPTKDNDYAEIDIMEHANYEDIAHQTLHSRYTLDGNNVPENTADVKIDTDVWNTYGVEIYQDSICMYINNIKTLTYPRVEGVKNQFPWADYDMFMIISNQLGGEWVQYVDGNELPSELRVDWIRVYERNED